MTLAWNVKLRVGDDEQVFQTVCVDDENHVLKIGSSALGDVTIDHPEVAPLHYWLIVNDVGYTWLRSAATNETMRFGVGAPVTVGDRTITLVEPPVPSEATWKLAFLVTRRRGNENVNELQVFHTDRVIVGRARGADMITLPTGNASRKHCVFQVRDGELYISDLGSTNGTHVDSRRVVGVEPFRVGMRLFIGDWQIQLAEPPKLVPRQR